MAADLNSVHAVVLGLVQGLTEFLPISSSAHLRIVPAVLGWKDPGAAFTAVIQLGTMFAVLLYFRADVVRIVGAWARGLVDRRARRELDSRLGWYVIVGTIPIGIVGLAFQDQITSTFRDLRLISAALIVFGLVMWVADHAGSKRRGVENVVLRDGVVIGLWQVLALLPGVSRSGSTISGGLFRGFDREAAARFSFLLSIPSVVASGLYELKDVGNGGGEVPVVPTAIATVVSFAVGYASIAWFLRYLTRHSLGYFVAYRVMLGGWLLALVAAGWLKAR